MPLGRAFIPHRQKDTAMIRITYIIFSAVTASALLVFPEIAAEAVADSLNFCLFTLIPALFPFFVLSGILTACGVGDLFGRIFGGAFERLFGVHRRYSAAFFIGALCGFPGGAKTAFELYKGSDESDVSDAEKALAFCSNCGPAYLILGVGSSLFGSAMIGVKLWLAQLAAAVAVGIILRGKAKAPSPPLMKIAGGVPISAPISALRGACTSIAMVCGTVVFFSVICRFAAIVLSPLPTAVRCIVMSFIELTSGIRSSAAGLPTREALVLCGFACGWSGLSVHAQTAAVTFGKLRLGRYLFGKLLCGIFTAVIMAFV